MAPTKKLTETEAVDIERKLVPILTNEASDLLQVNEDVQVRFKRPKFMDKYKFQTWTSTKLDELGLDARAEATSEITFYFTYFGILNGNVVELRVKGQPYELDPNKGYKFLFEQYVMEEVYPTTNNEEVFVFDTINKFLDWQSVTEVPAEDIKNS